MGLIRRAGLQSEMHTDVLSMFWGLDCLCEPQIIHNVLDVGSEYFRMNAVIVHDSVSRQEWVIGKLTAWLNQHGLRSTNIDL